MYQVYAMREVGSRGVYKFGFSNNVKKRKYNLASGNYRDLEVAAILGEYESKQDAAATEKFLKEYFAESKIKREWYEVNMVQLKSPSLQRTLLTNQAIRQMEREE